MSHFSARFGNKPGKSYIWIRADDAYFVDEIYNLLYDLNVWFFAEKGFLSMDNLEKV